MKEIKKYTAQCVAELFATFMLILIGESAIAQFKFSGNNNQSPILINLSFGIGVYTALMIAGSISGAHLNPAVTIALLTVRQIKPIQCVFYIIGQMLGGFFGGLFVYLLHMDLFHKYDDGNRQIIGDKGTGDIFFTIRASGVHNINALFDQIVGTAVLMIFIMALNKKTNKFISETGKPFAFVLIIVAITSAFATNCGAAINPARDLGPRLFAAFLYGWRNVFTTHDYFFWIPVVGPIVGGIIGVWIFEGYYMFVERFSDLSDESKNERIELPQFDGTVIEEAQQMLSPSLKEIRS